MEEYEIVELEPDWSLTAAEYSETFDDAIIGWDPFKEISKGVKKAGKAIKKAGKSVAKFVDKNRTAIASVAGTIGAAVVAIPPVGTAVGGALLGASAILVATDPKKSDAQKAAELINLGAKAASKGDPANAAVYSTIANTAVAVQDGKISPQEASQVVANVSKAIPPGTNAFVDAARGGLTDAEQAVKANVPGDAYAAMTTAALTGNINAVKEAAKETLGDVTKQELAILAKTATEFDKIANRQEIALALLSKAQAGDAAAIQTIATLKNEAQKKGASKEAVQAYASIQAASTGIILEAKVSPQQALEAVLKSPPSSVAPVLKKSSDDWSFL